jgi:predicted nucleotide-binding protein
MTLCATASCRAFVSEGTSASPGRCLKSGSAPTGEITQTYQDAGTVPEASTQPDAQPVRLLHVPFHVRISRRTNRGSDELALDLDEATLLERFVTPYLQGRPITTGGMTIPADDIERMRVNRTEQSAAELLPVIQAERRASRVATLIPDEWYVTEKGENLTDQFITGAPGSILSNESADGQGTASPTDLRRVFVVHGRNVTARDAMFTFLRAVGLEPLEWEQMVAEAHSGIPYIGDVLDAGLASAAGVLVFMTPDDEARLRAPLRRPTGEPRHETELTGQARPNVLFEAGMALGRYPARTVIVELGALRPFSDLAGRHTVRLDNSTQRRQALADRLASLGFAVDLKGKTDWHTAGDFDGALV